MMTRKQVLQTIMDEAAQFLHADRKDIYVDLDSGDDFAPQLYVMLGVKGRPGYHGFLYDERGDINYMGGFSRWRKVP